MIKLIKLTVRTHGQQPQKTDIYRARARGWASAVGPIAVVRAQIKRYVWSTK